MALDQIQIIISNAQGSLNIHATKLQYNSKNKRRPSSLELEILQSDKLIIEPGNAITAVSNKSNFFCGFIFKVQYCEDYTIKLLCYDQIRYLLCNDTYIFEQKTASEILTLISKDFGLKTVDIQDTGIPFDIIYQDKSLLFMIENSLDLTKQSSGQDFVLLDNAGSLTLKNINQNRCSKNLGDFSLVEKYNYCKEIDAMTHNKIKLSKKNKKSGNYKTYIAKDQENINKWGSLQFFDRVEETLSDAQAQSRADSLLAQYNKQRESIVLDAIGDFEFRAGFQAQINIKNIYSGSAQIVDAQHWVFQDKHTMRLELKLN